MVSEIKIDNTIFNGGFSTPYRMDHTAKSIFLEFLNKHAPMKQKYLRTKQRRFMAEDLHKAIIKHCRLTYKFFRYRTKISQKEF